MSLSDKARWAHEIYPAVEMQRVLGNTREDGRSLGDFPDDLPPGVREVAIVTVFAREQNFAFEPVMKALSFLAELEDWSGSFLVPPAELGASFNWRQAGWAKYASFAEFYQRELHQTWGAWEDLQNTYARVARGELTEAEGRRIVLGTQGAPLGNQNAAKDKPGNKGGNATFKPEEKNTVKHILARLDRDGHTELAAQVRADTMSANAAALEAGYRKKPTAFEAVVKLLPKLTLEEKRELIEMLRHPAA